MDAVLAWPNKSGRRLTARLVELDLARGCDCGGDEGELWEEESLVKVDGDWRLLLLFFLLLPTP